jgi:hypothetical protein
MDMVRLKCLLALNGGAPTTLDCALSLRAIQKLVFVICVTSLHYKMKEKISKHPHQGRLF